MGRVAQATRLLVGSPQVFRSQIAGMMTLAESLTEESLILRLRSTEHDFVERKPRSAKGDWLQAAVAFANSAPIGWPAVVFQDFLIGLRPGLRFVAGIPVL